MLHILISQYIYYDWGKLFFKFDKSSFVKKHVMNDSKLNNLLENSNSFKNRLSENQKKAILVAFNMMSLTSSNFEPSQENSKSLGRIILHLGIEVKQDSSNRVDASNHLEILSTLSHFEKTWVLSVLVFISKIPGEMSENSINNVLKKGLEIGVPIDQITEIIFLS